MKASLSNICLSFILPPSSFNLLRPAARVGDVEGRRAAEARAVRAFERGSEPGEPLPPHEAHGRAAEAAARHARAQHALDAPGGLSQEVQLGAAHLVVVAQGLVR